MNLKDFTKVKNVLVGAKQRGTFEPIALSTTDKTYIRRVGPDKEKQIARSIVMDVENTTTGGIVSVVFIFDFEGSLIETHVE